LGSLLALIRAVLGVAGQLLTAGAQALWLGFVKVVGARSVTESPVWIFPWVFGCEITFAVGTLKFHFPPLVTRWEVHLLIGTGSSVKTIGR
jgi:hypothetical protein